MAPHEYRGIWYLVRYLDDAVLQISKKSHIKYKKGQCFIKYIDKHFYPGSILFKSGNMDILQGMVDQLVMEPIVKLIRVTDEENMIEKYAGANLAVVNVTKTEPVIISSNYINTFENMSDNYEMQRNPEDENVSEKYVGHNLTAINVTKTKPVIISTNFSNICEDISDDHEMQAIPEGGNVSGACILIEDIHFDINGNILKRKIYNNVSGLSENSLSGKKKEYCLFCKSIRTHISRHFITCHKDERRVKNFMYLPLKSLERRKRIEELRKEGQLENNTQRNPEMLMSMRRSKKKGTNLKDLRICPYCKGYYRRLRAHIPSCKPDATNQRNNNALGRKYSQMIHHAASDKIKSIFSIMRPDNVFLLVSQDELIIKCANRWASRYRHTKDENMIRARVRLLGRFLIEFNKLSERTHSFMEVFSPQLSDRVIKSINSVACLGISEKYAYPNVAKELGTLLKKCASIYNYILIENQEKVKKKDLKDFCVLLYQNLSDSINKTVMENVAELKRQKVISLPQESDIIALRNFVANRASLFLIRFQTDKTLSNYTSLSSFVLVALIIFNRRRPGETERLLINDYYSGSIAEYEGGEYYRINIRGKLGRTVKLYLNSFQKKCVDCLLEFREDVGLNASNPYVFGLPDIVSQFKYMRACPYFRKYSVECQAQQPELLRGTLLRKQVATKAANLQLNDAEIGDLADFMGHAEKIHREHYRISEQHREMNVLNLLQEGGVPSDNLTHNVNTQADGLIFQDTNTDKEFSEYSGEESEIEEIKIRRKRISWTQEEKILMSSVFSKHIETEVPPSLQECVVFKRKYTSIEKPVEAVKVFIKNKISQLKRKPFECSAWSKSEMNEVKKRFHQNLRCKKLPSEYECEVFLQENKQMKSRSPLSVKLWIHNYLNKQKEKQMSHSF